VSSLKNQKCLHLTKMILCVTTQRFNVYIIILYFYIVFYKILEHLLK